jgi:hypothetical protein
MATFEEIFKRISDFKKKYDLKIIEFVFDGSNLFLRVESPAIITEFSRDRGEFNVYFAKKDHADFWYSLPKLSNIIDNEIVANEFEVMMNYLDKNYLLVVSYLTGEKFLTTEKEYALMLEKDYERIYGKNWREIMKK